MSSDSFQPYMKLVAQATDHTVASATAQGTASITFANPADATQIYYLYLSSYKLGDTGPYTLSVNVTNPPPGAAAAASASGPRSVAAHVLRRGDPGRGPSDRESNRAAVSKILIR
jgi:hypothetical protein